MKELPDPTLAPHADVLPPEAMGALVAAWPHLAMYADSHEALRAKLAAALELIEDIAPWLDPIAISSMGPETEDLENLCDFLLELAPRVEALRPEVAR
jgi:hypothetical protein